jgi:cation diffusion facilitator CzcD-associated flavoprotein CzcO
VRRHPFAMPFVSRSPSALAVDERTRSDIYQEAWDKGGFYFLFESFDDLQIDEAANETACEFIRAKIREIVEDPQIAELLTPRGYPYGAKRPPAGTGYYEAYNRDDVTLVDLSDDPIEEITRTGLRTREREFEADVIVFATGFDASTGSFSRIDIRGRDGVALAEKWREGPVANLGLGVHGFPNLLMITGPLSPFANIPTCVEETADWIVGAIAHLRKNGMTTIETTEETEREWTRHVGEVADMIMAGRGEAVHTWFAGANIEGKSRAINVYFGGANNFFAACRAAAENDYQGFVLS